MRKRERERRAPPPLPLERVLIECSGATSAFFLVVPHEEAGRLVGKAVRLLGMRVQGN